MGVSLSNTKRRLASRLLKSYAIAEEVARGGGWVSAPGMARELVGAVLVSDMCNQAVDVTPRGVRVENSAHALSYIDG